jgi:hypothetical protein
MLLNMIHDYSEESRKFAAMLRVRAARMPTQEGRFLALAARHLERSAHEYKRLLGLLERIKAANPGLVIEDEVEGLQREMATAEAMQALIRELKGGPDE